MPLRDRIRKFKSDVKSRILRADKANTSVNAGTSQTSTTPAPGTAHNWTHLRSLLRTLEQATKPLPPLKAAVTAIVECVDIYENVSLERKEYGELCRELEELFQALQVHCTGDAPPAITTVVEALCGSIQSEVDDIRQKLGRSGMGHKRGGGTLSPNSLLLAAYFDMSVWRIVDETVADNRLKHLSPSLSARYNSAHAVEHKHGPCTENTRVDLLRQMFSWIDSSGPGSIYWMSGMAGTGKMTIAYSLCLKLETNQRLVASFFCSRLLPKCRDVNLIMPSIAYQLACLSRPFRFVLSRVPEKDPDVDTQLPHIQFNALVAQPLLEIKDTLPDSLVVIINALDECENKESTRKILDVLLSGSSDLPVKFIVSSRPEPEIRDEMTKQHDQAGSRVTYLRSALAEIQPIEKQIATLVERAGILFIYAATVVRYVGHDGFRRNPRARLAIVLGSSSTSENKHKQIDELYTIILRAALDDPTMDQDEREDVRQVLHTVVCAQEPLTVDALSGLLQMNDTDRVRAALRPLWSVLHISGESELVTTLHASFPDYMLELSRSKEYHCDSALHNQAVRPQFNICGLESSYVPDDKVEGLEA
ncbi:hypothetical protein FRC11_003559, partial [Ceratobasidium sp. 423]